MLSLENFLDKEDRRKFDFLRLLEESSDLTALNTTIQAQLSLSNFLFNKTIEELSLDFENYGLEVYFAIDSNNVQTTLLEVGQATSDLLLAHYLRNSLSFAILLALFREDYQSANNFALESYTSYTNVYSHTQQIKKLLKELQIEVSKKYHLAGNEGNVRYLLTRIFSFVLASDTDVYPDTYKSKVAKIIDELSETGISLPRNVQTKLFHFLAISLMRHDKQYQLAKKDINKQKVLEKLKAVYAQEFQVIQTVDIDPSIQEEVLAYLYTNGMLSREKMKNQELGKRINRLNERFIQYFTDSFHIEDRQTQEILTAELNRLHFELAYFPLNAFNSFERFDVSFFKESYIEYFLFCRDYLMDDAFVKEENFSAYRPYIFYKYLMILVSNVELERVMPQITICIDFSFGQEYNEFIKRNLTFFVNLNVAVQFVFDESTDIVITNLNSEYEALDVEKVIWLDPPRAIDWAHLGNQLLEIRAQKHQQANV